MITDFQQFGLIHLASIFITVLIGLVFFLIWTRSKSKQTTVLLRTLLMIILISVRGARYILDVFYDRFDILDLFSLHICHIDLILLAICLVRPRSGLFGFVFLLGIPAGLSVALFPGSIHPVPGLPRAVLFIMSHMMLVVGAFYLLLTERLVIRLRHMLTIIIAGIIGLAGIFAVNLILRSNFLYLNEAPPGTIIETLDQAFGWPGYVFALIVLAVLLMFFMYGIWRLFSNRQKHAGQAELFNEYSHCSKKLTD